MLSRKYTQICTREWFRHEVCRIFSNNVIDQKIITPPILNLIPNLRTTETASKFLFQIPFNITRSLVYTAEWIQNSWVLWIRVALCTHHCYRDWNDSLKRKKDFSSNEDNATRSFSYPVTTKSLLDLEGVALDRTPFYSRRLRFLWILSCWRIDG